MVTRAQSLWSRLRCALGLHDRRITHVEEDRRSAMAHLSPFAGCRSECVRCGDVWDHLSVEGRAEFARRGVLPAPKEGRDWP